MLEPWNDSSILPPPVHTSSFTSGSNIGIPTQILFVPYSVQYEIGYFTFWYLVSDIKQLMYTCNSIIKVLTKQSPLHKEGAIVSRFVYKLDKKFRNDIGYRTLKKVNTALKRYLVINLLKDVENFQSVLPSDDDDLYLPTRQMLEYVLIRVMTFSKLMLRICVCAKQASVFYLHRVKRGESHWMSLMPYTLLCRVWSMSSVLLQHSCSWYSNLYPFLDKLPLKGMDFLPADYKLPQNIEEWLNMNDLDSMGKYKWSQKKQININTDLYEDDEVDMLDTMLEFVNQINDNSPMEQLKVKSFSDGIRNNEDIQVSAVKTVDHGEKISRDSFNRLTKGFEVHKVTSHYPNRVSDKNTLQDFIETEESLRNDNNSKSLTSHLSFMQWQTLKNALLKLHESLISDKRIKKKFLKIWQDKCLDYCT